MSSVPLVSSVDVEPASSVPSSVSVVELLVDVSLSSVSVVELAALEPELALVLEALVDDDALVDVKLEDELALVELLDESGSAASV